MANLFFPQLSTGAIAQFPFGKIRSVRTVENALPDGSLLVSPDSTSSRITWNLHFNELLPSEMLELQEFYSACIGPFSAFTFIDPADNMLISSSDLTNSAWNLSLSLKVTPGLTDPFGGTTAFAVTNTGQTAATVTQTIAVPANYQYCFSVYLLGLNDSDVTLSMTGSTASASQSFGSESAWSRIVLPGRLNDSGTTLTAVIQLQPGQSVQLFGPQLEPQASPSSYRATTSQGGVYTASHWSSNQLAFSANGPNSFATSFAIESVL